MMMDSKAGLGQGGDKSGLVCDGLRAMTALRTGRDLFFLILLVAFMIPFVVYTAAARGMFSSPSGSITSTSPSQQPPPTTGSGRDWQGSAQQALRWAPFVARLMTLLLIVVYVMAVQVCLAYRMGGVGDCIVAFFWMVVLMLFLVPWHKWMGGQDIPAIFFDLDDLLKCRAALGANWLGQANFYGRYLVFPFLGLLAAGVAYLRFNRADRELRYRLRRSLE